MNEKLVKSLDNNYGLKVKDASLINSYFRRVWKVTTHQDQNYIVKILGTRSEKDLQHHQAENTFIERVNQNVFGLKVVPYLKNNQAGTVQSLDIHPDYREYYLVMAEHPIIVKNKLTPAEQKQLARLMAGVHSVMSDFDHQGLNFPDYMRELKDEELQKLPEIFPDEGYIPYIELMRPLNYQRLGLPLTVIHGDWHQANTSFTNPVVLFDLDTLSKGARVEEIARTLTHWWMEPEEIKEFYDNLTSSYPCLTEFEKELIPKLMMAQLYRKYFEYLDYKDEENAKKVKDSIPKYKKLFNLP